MGLDTTIQRFRQKQEALFRSECRITRPSDDTPVLNTTTGDVEPTPGELIYEGPCQIRAATVQSQDVEAGEAVVRLRKLVLKLPANTPVQKDDNVTIVFSEHDDGLENRAFRITDVPHDDWQIARVALLEEQDG